jgi:2-succinyl-6-hydroxy-2,4-cyclohexadiene-1-carboxylate synthase
VAAVDLPGHGGSAEQRGDLLEAADAVVQAGRTAFGGVPFDLLGYSLGARVALRAALEHPEALQRLVLVSGTAGIDDDDARAARRGRDEALARGLEQNGGVERFLDRWLTQPLFATLAPEAAQGDERRRNSAAGLASSLRLAGTGSQTPLWDRLGTLDVPVLVLAGATDPRYVALGVRLASALPRAHLAVVPGAGHAVTLEQPATAAAVVEGWLSGPAPAARHPAA